MLKMTQKAKTAAEGVKSVYRQDPDARTTAMEYIVLNERFGARYLFVGRDRGRNGAHASQKAVGYDQESLRLSQRLCITEVPPPLGRSQISRLHVSTQ